MKPVFISEDGNVFDTAEECIEYESGRSKKNKYALNIEVSINTKVEVHEEIMNDENEVSCFIEEKIDSIYRELKSKYEEVEITGSMYRKII